MAPLASYAVSLDVGSPSRIVAEGSVMESG